MRYYPVNLDIRHRKCLVVGGGAVGTRKVKTLLKCGGRVTVISPTLTPTLQDLYQQKRIEWREKEYQSPDLDGMFLVIGATDDETLNRKISTDAQRNNQLCNIADRPAICNFILPSIVHQGDLIIGISTSGKSPALAKQLRQEMEKQFGSEYADFLTIMGAIRKKLLAREHEPEAHKHLFEQIINRGAIDYIRNGKIDELDKLLKELIGPGFQYNELIKKDEI
jgi:precorrin-2 dehydrogenase/sirohydrochlorin ferrochelatase